MHPKITVRFLFYFIFLSKNISKHIFLSFSGISQNFYLVLDNYVFLNYFFL